MFELVVVCAISVHANWWPTSLRTRADIHCMSFAEYEEQNSVNLFEAWNQDKCNASTSRAYCNFALAPLPVDPLPSNHCIGWMHQPNVVHPTALSIPPDHFWSSDLRCCTLIGFATAKITGKPKAAKAESSFWGDSWAAAFPFCHCTSRIKSN